MDVDHGLNDLALSMVSGDPIGGVKALSTALGITTANQRMNAYLQQEFVDWISEIAIELKDRVDRLEEERTKPTASDVLAVVAAVQKVYANTADQTKRDMLRRAVVNAFDADLYQKGLTLQLLSILDRLTYGDVFLLRELASGAKESQPRKWYGPNDQGAAQKFVVSIERISVLTLIDAGLVYPSVPTTDRQWRSANIQVWPTKLGHLLLRLLAEKPSGKEVPDQGHQQNPSDR